MDECSLGIHEIKLVIDSREDFGDGSGVGKHEEGSIDLGKIGSGNGGGGLIVDSALESSGAPIDELDGSLALHGGNGRGDILGDDISSVHEAAGHVLSSSRIALGHHVSGLEDGVGEISNGQLLVVSLLLGDDGSIRAKHKVDSGIGNQVSLELVDVDVEGSSKSEGSSQRGDELSNQSVEVGVVGLLDVQRSVANVVDGLVIQKEGNIGVLQEGVS
jgi:hypothetical protein